MDFVDEVVRVHDVAIGIGGSNQYYYLVELQNGHWAYVNRAQACFISPSAERCNWTTQILSCGNWSDARYCSLLVIDEICKKGDAPNGMGRVQQLPFHIAHQRIRVQTLFNRTILQPRNLAIYDVAGTSLLMASAHINGEQGNGEQARARNPHQSITIYCK